MAIKQSLADDFHPRFFLDPSLDLSIFFLHGLNVQVVNLSACPHLRPPEPHPPVYGLNRVTVLHFQLEVEHHLVVGLGNLEDTELIGAVLALTGTNSVLLHASLVPDLISFMLETQHTLRDVRHLIRIMHDPESIGDEGRHESRELIISYSWLTHRVQLLHMSIDTLQVGCGHNSQSSSQAMPGEHNSIMPVDGVKVIDVLLHLSLNAVEALIEPYVDRTAIAEGITGADCLEIEDPVGSVHASSEGNDHTLVFRRVANIAVNTVGVIGNYLCTYKIDVLTHLA